MKEKFFSCKKKKSGNRCGYFNLLEEMDQDLARSWGGMVNPYCKMRKFRFQIVGHQIHQVCSDNLLQRIRIELVKHRKSGKRDFQVMMGIFTTFRLGKR